MRPPNDLKRDFSTPRLNFTPVPFFGPAVACKMRHIIEHRDPFETSFEPTSSARRGGSPGSSWLLLEVLMEEMARNVDWVDEIEVSAIRIQRYLRSLLIDVDIDDEGYLFLKDGLEHPAHIYIDEPRKLIHLIAQVPLRPDEGLHAAAVNELNRDYVGVQLHTLYGALWANAWLSYKTGICLRHLAHMVPLFASAVLHAVHEPCIRHLIQRDLRISH